MIYPMPLINRIVTKHGQGSVVVLPGYGYWFLGLEDDGADKADLYIYKTVQSIEMVRNSFSAEEFPVGLSTSDG